MLKTKYTSKNALYFLIVGVVGICFIWLGMAGNLSNPTNHLKTLNRPLEATNSAIVVEQQIRQIAQSEGFEWPDYLVRLARCESGLDPHAIGDSGYSRGLFQIHELYWPSVSDGEAFDIEWSAKWTMDLINSGYQHYWSCDKIVKNI